jgi:hypothetical protein
MLAAPARKRCTVLVKLRSRFKTVPGKPGTPGISPPAGQKKLASKLQWRTGGWECVGGGWAPDEACGAGWGVVQFGG